VYVDSKVPIECTMTLFSQQATTSQDTVIQFSMSRRCLTVFATFVGFHLRRKRSFLKATDQPEKKFSLKKTKLFRAKILTGPSPGRSRETPTWTRDLQVEVNFLKFVFLPVSSLGVAAPVKNLTLVTLV